MILATGAMHEDGLADFADGLAGDTKERSLSIMRDHQIGTYRGERRDSVAQGAVVALVAHQRAARDLCRVPADRRACVVEHTAQLAWLSERYGKLLRAALERPRRVAAATLVLAALGLLFYFRLETGFLPEMDEGGYVVDYWTPEGTSLEGSSEVAMGLVKELSGIEGVAQLQPTITERVTHIHLIAQALPLDQRTNTQEQMVSEMRRRLAKHPGLKPSITNRNPIGGGESGGFPISANLLGPDLQVLASGRVSDHVRQLVLAGNKIGAIKAYRDETNADLATATRLIESLYG